LQRSRSAKAIIPNPLMSLRNNTLWNLAGSGLPLIAAAALIPFMLQRLGNEAFGVLTLIWALIGYFSLFDMGVGRALTYELSKLRGAAYTDSAQQHSEISLTLKAGVQLTLCAGKFVQVKNLE
jgi:O-antigen/teichoic acid export membrane protein